MLLLHAGDIELNPGPRPDSDPLLSDITNETSDIIKHNFSIVHYNVQSAVHKIDLLETELSNFDVISITETWFTHITTHSDIQINGFRSPFRKDRPGDGHGGVAVYIKSEIPCIRRHDLEILNLECVWIEIRLPSKGLLIGTFYRPPNSDNTVLNNIENSIDLARDTDIPEIIILGDFNLDMNKAVSSGKINNICRQYDLHQIINEHTHFTERSSSLIDIILTSNPNSILLSGVDDPFLNLEIRYHCPIFIVFKFTKPHRKPIKRHIWKYKDGDYENPKHKFGNTDWNSFANEDIDIYSKNVTDHIFQLSSECIPNKIASVPPSETPWMHNELRK